MALYKRKDSPFWWSKLHVRGRVHYFSTGQRAKSEALKAERGKVEELEAALPKQGRMDLATLGALFIEAREAEGKRAEIWTATMFKHLAKKIVPHFGADRDVRSIDAEAMEEYRDMRLRAVSESTVAKELSTLRLVMKHAVKLKVIKAAPTVKNPSFRYEPKWRLLTNDEVGRILEALRHFRKGKERGRELLPFFLLFANTGMRPSEMLGLDWSMVDWPGLALRLPARICKTRRPRVMDINEGCEAALRLLGDEKSRGKIFHEKQHYGAWHAAVANAGIEGRVRPYDLRHSFASRLHASGASMPVVRDSLGHETMMMASLYAHAFDDDRKRAIAAVSVLPNVTNSVTFGGRNVTNTASNGQNGAVGAVEEMVAIA